MVLFEQQKGIIIVFVDKRRKLFNFRTLNECHENTFWVIDGRVGAGGGGEEMKKGGDK